MANLTYLITGPTRGIGRTLFETLAARSDASTLIAAVRNPLDVNTQSLLELQKHSNCKIIIVKIDGECDGDAAVAIEELQKKNNIQHLDIVVANAGAITQMAPLASTSTAAFHKMLAVNAIAPLALFQATLPLLKMSKRPGTFVLIGSKGATFSLAGQYAKGPTSAYMAAKATAHFNNVVLHHQNPELLIYTVSPGLVASGLGLEAASQFGGTPESVKEQYRKMGAIELEESGAAVAYVIDNAGIDSCNGTQISASDTLKNKDMVFFGW